jgi:uncharacterized protein (TIGR02246 family)
MHRRLILLIVVWALNVYAADDATRLVGAVRDQWAKDWNGKQLDHIATLYAPNADFLSSNGARYSGVPAIRDYFKSVLAKNTPSITMRSATLEVSGDLAFDSGTYDETVVTGTKSRALHGNYLMVLRRQNGKWLIAEQMWSEAAPMPANAGPPKN